MKSIRIVIALLFLSLTFLLAFCKKTELKEPYKIPAFTRITESIIEENLVFPSGLSKGSNVTKSSFNSGENPGINGVFTDGPLFINLWADGGIQNYENPKVYQFSGTFDKISTEFISQFELNNYAPDFADTSHFLSRDYDALISTSLFALRDSLWRPYGLTLDGLILNDGSINSHQRTLKLVALEK